MLRLLAEGRSAAEVAASLGCVVEAVEQELAALLGQLGLAGRAQAALYATRAGLAQTDLSPYLATPLL